MNKHIKAFLFRGLTCAAGGPVILSIIYGILGATGAVTTLSPLEVSKGILSITLMAFIAAGITCIYHVERLPLLSAILIHGGVLYLDYLLMYMLNSWIPRNWEGIASFSVIFIASYAVTWICLYLSIRAKARRINQKFSK